MSRLTGSPEELERYRVLAAEFIAASPSTARWLAMSDKDRAAWFAAHPNIEALDDEQERTWFAAHPTRGDDEDGSIVLLGGIEYDERTGDKINHPRRPSRARGRTAGGVRYRGAKRDRSGDPYYVFTPANVVSAVEEKRLDASVIPYASILYQHVRRSERYKDKGQRIKCAEVAAKLHRSERSARRAIDEMVRTGELEVISSGQGNRNGAIYRFPGRGK